MTESDDYDFSSTDNSLLSRLFQKDQSFGEGSSSLIYKAPREPVITKVNTSKTLIPKFFYKYINLYEIVGENYKLLGKHIIGLVVSDTNGTEMLIYQSKKNILIRRSIKAITVFDCTTRNFCLNLLANDRKWLLEFNSEEDYTDFSNEFGNFGGMIESRSELSQSIKEDSNQKHVSSPLQLPILTELESSIIDPSENVDEDSSTDNVDSKKEKEDILARLARMGLPQLPSFQKETENIGSFETGATKKSSDKNVIDEEKNKSSINSSINKIRKPYSLENIQGNKEIRNDIVAVTSGLRMCELEHHERDDQIQVLNTMREIDPMNLILAENRINNAELRQHISLLTSKINEITNSKKVDEDKTCNQLRSQLRAFQIKTENLEIDLSRCRKNCEELQKVTVELSLKLEKSYIQTDRRKLSVIKNDDCTQTDDSVEGNCDEETLNYRSQLLEVLNFLDYCLPLNQEKLNLTQLRNLMEHIKDDELSVKFESTLNLLQENIDSQKIKLDSIASEKRSNFIKNTKEVMNDLYSNLCLALYDKSEMKTLLAKQIRHVTSEVIRYYDE